MCTMGQCMKLRGQWVHFYTQWGYHRGIIEDVNNRAVLVRMPRRYAPLGLASHAPQLDTGATDEQRLDLVLAAVYGPGWGYRGWGYPGWGAWWGGWWWWWLAFWWIFALAALWW
ncbi:hypothetical protein [Alicyclobacillus sp.]|uniref:hypothetical protein n=1 Tax=Alicyclobacillus sp. TaxID=61169 RepID=UPI0025C590AD|nr:hypothetical protein [Alicyclobacillus sp.]MCL6516647.1 hypothetical protein [Alicyclobacillus sp.]